jgi:hypothetical protein
MPWRSLRREAAGRWLVLGALVAITAQVLEPVAVPLYDGVPIVAPYRYLDPGDNQVGQPTAYSADLPVSNGRSPAITAATSESPPQAQLIALDGVFAVPAGVSGLHVSIDAVQPPAPIGQGSISGNVYRIVVTDPTGNEVPMAGSGLPTLAMRSAGPLADAAIFRLDGATWKRLETVANESLSIYTAQPDALGDFAVVDLAAGGISTTTLVVGATVAVVVAAVAIWAIRTWLRGRMPPSPAPSRPARRGNQPRRRR